MKLLIFGKGKFYANRKHYISDEIVAFIDNSVKGECFFEEKQLLHPTRWGEVEFEKILLMSSSQGEMKKQLLELGVVDDMIFTWDEYYDFRYSGKIDLYINATSSVGKKILVLTESLNYNGGSLTAAYAAMAMKNRGFEVWLAGASKNMSVDYINEIGSQGINIAVLFDCPNIKEADLYWINQFDMVLVNVFQMIKCAVEINKIKPVLWWLHEPKIFYSCILDKFSNYNDISKMMSLNILGVSNVAKRAFNAYFSTVSCGIMPYGIPDTERIYHRDNPKDKRIFAIIGAVAFLKGQDIFLSAVKKLLNTCQVNAEFWIIGFIGNDDYSNEIRDMSLKIPGAKIEGNMNRKQIRRVFNEIDIVVCASREETMSLAITEGMMHSKICISSDRIGMADYIEDGENGFIFESENIEMLYQKMKYVLNNEDKMNFIKKNARRTYENFFSMDSFGERLGKELINAEEKFARCHGM